MPLKFVDISFAEMLEANGIKIIGAKATRRVRVSCSLTKVVKGFFKPKEKWERK